MAPNSIVELLIATSLGLIFIYLFFRLSSLAIFKSFKQTFSQEEDNSNGKEKQEVKEKSSVSERRFDESDEKISATAGRRDGSTQGKCRSYDLAS